jgi:plasmid stability protein
MYLAYMGSLVQIRNVPEELRRALKARAASRGESLNTYLLRVLEEDVRRPTVAEVLERAARRAERASASAVEVMDEARGEREQRLERKLA